jgi:hypothetical protein
MVLVECNGVSKRSRSLAGFDAEAPDKCALYQALDAFRKAISFQILLQSFDMM